MHRTNARTILKILLLAVCVTALLISASAPARAADGATGAVSAQSGKNAVMMREVTVTATRAEREVFDVPSSAAVVGAKAMEREPMATIAQQLQDIPGVQVNDGGMGGGAKRVSIRGEGPSRVLILIDGMKISEQKSMDGSMIMIDPLNVERIEVIKGPASVLYGSEAIGGVVNIITKKGGAKPLQATLALTGDTSTDSLTPYASIYGTHKGFSYRLSGDYIDAGRKRGGSGRIADTGYMQRNMSAYLDYAWDKAKIGAGYDHYWGNISIPGAHEENAAGITDITMHLPKWQRDRFYAFGELDDISSVLKKVKLNGFYQETQKDFWNDINVNASPMQVWQHPFTKNEQNSYGLNLQTDWTLGDDHYLIVGVDYLYDDLDAKDHRQGRVSMQGPGMPFPVPISNTDDTYTYKGHQQTLAVFAQDEWTLHKDWTLTFGLRQTWVQSALDSTSDPALKDDSSSDNHLVGSAGLVYSGFKDWRFRAMYSQGYRYPLINQLYIGTTHGSSGRMYPNPDLDPESSQSFELGARFDNQALQADFSLYHSIAKDYISSRSLPGNTGDSIFENVDKAKTWGAELTLSYTHEPLSLTPYLSGALMRRTFDRGENGGKTSKTGNPRWTGRVGLKYENEVTKAFTLHADLYGRFADKAKEELSDGSEEIHSGWGTANFAIGARLGEEQNWFIDLNLNNIFNKTYTLASSTLEEPGFHAVMRVGVEF